MMELMERSATDKRLDDLNHKVDRGFERIDADIRGLQAESRTEFTALRGEMKAGFDAMSDRFDAVHERFERTHRLLIQFCGGLLGAVIVAGAGLIATQL